jgi:hypothetical protein
MIDLTVQLQYSTISKRIPFKDLFLVLKDIKDSGFTIIQYSYSQVSSLRSESSEEASLPVGRANVLEGSRG